MTLEQQSTQPLLPQLQSHCDQLVTMLHEVRQLSDGLSDVQWYWSPTAQAWSIGQCIDHLNVVHTLLLPRFEAAIGQAQAQGKYSDGPFHYYLLERWFVRMLGPDAPIKQRVPRLYTPAPHPATPDIVLAQFAALQHQLISCIKAANGLDLVRVKVVSPVSRFVRASLGAWFAATVAHEHNHLVQAQRVRAHPHFPSSQGQHARRHRL